jgi:hypothetical protein
MGRASRDGWPRASVEGLLRPEPTIYDAGLLVPVVAIRQTENVRLAGRSTSVTTERTNVSAIREGQHPSTPVRTAEWLKRRIGAMSLR